jgi:predicted nucleic acid-binding protein
MIVVDVNVVAYFFIEGEKTASAQALYRCDPDWILPPLWRHEFLNVLATYARAGGASTEAVQALYQQSIDILANSEREVDMADALALATRLSPAPTVSAYDAQYVSLARELGVACVSEDQRLQRAFPGLVCSMQRFMDDKNHDG